MRMAAYCRVSTEKEEQISSLKNQKAFFEQYAHKSGDELIRIYADEGISGKSMKKREAFLNMLEDSKKNEFDYIAVKDISRFARNTSDFLYGIRCLRANGVDVRFLSGNMTVIGESEFILTVFAALAQEESSNLSQRVIFGKKQNAKKGCVPNVIYGYNREDAYNLKINEEESYVVELIFKWYISGYGMRHIASMLNSLGIPTKKNLKWIPQTISRILQNPVYTGNLINNKSVTKDFLTGTRMKLPKEEWFIHSRPQLRIVTDEDFNLVQKQISERKKHYCSNNPGNRYSNRHVFSNLIWCGECGKGFTAKVYNGKNTYIRYRCSVNNNKGKEFCRNNVSIDENLLLREIKGYLLSAISDKEAFSHKLKELYKKRCGSCGAEYMSSLKLRLEKRKTKLKELYLNGYVEIAEFKKEIECIEKNLKNIESKISGVSEYDKNLEKIYDNEFNIESIVMENQFNNLDMRSIINKIIIYSDKSAEIYIK